MTGGVTGQIATDGHSPDTQPARGSSAGTDGVPLVSTG